eukprot:319979_1
MLPRLYRRSNPSLNARLCSTYSQYIHRYLFASGSSHNYAKTAPERLGIDLSQPLKSRTVPGYLHRAYIGSIASYSHIEREYPEIYTQFLELCLVFEYQIARGDNVLSDVEMENLYKLQDLFGLPRENVDAIIQKYDKIHDIDSKWKEFSETEAFVKMGELLGRKTKYDHLTCVLLAGLEVASVDGLHTEEIQRAYEIATLLGVDEQTIDKILLTLDAERKLLAFYDELL